MDFYEYEALLEEENRLTLQHHGILGQKWGRRNGPPYPIEKGQHSAAEKKADPSVDRNSSGSSKKTVKSLSNQELKEYTERTRLENEFIRQQYESMKLAQGPQIQQGKTFLQKTADTAKTLSTLAVSINTITKMTTGKDLVSILQSKTGKSSDTETDKKEESSSGRFPWSKDSTTATKGNKFNADKWLKKNIDTDSAATRSYEEKRDEYIANWLKSKGF